MTNTGNKHTVLFNEVIERLDNTAFGKYDLIVGISSGGIVPASLAAYKLKTDLKIIKINFRDELNNPRYDEPRILDEFEMPAGVKTLLLVDDVSVTGSTLDKAKSLLGNYDITTLVMKGKGDFVLFPEIKTCVNWPWK